MKLTTFDIIVTVDRNYHIVNNGYSFFYMKKSTYIKEVIIMDKSTYNIILSKYNIPNDKKIVVLDDAFLINVPRVYNGDHIIEYMPTLLSVLKTEDLDGYNVYIMGGENLYHEALSKFSYLCKTVYINKLNGERKSNQIFPQRLLLSLPHNVSIVNMKKWTLYTFKLNISHQEDKYLSLMGKIMKKGEVRKDRTGVGTKSLFGVRMKFDLSKEFPLFTTKRVPLQMILKELLFFISGKTDTKILEKHNVNIWKDNTSTLKERAALQSKEFLTKRGLKYEEGDYGPSYGFQWRHSGAKYDEKSRDKDYTGKGVDQLTKLIDQIKNNPYSRRHILTAWNPLQLGEMALSPCHAWCQFYVSEDKRLDCQLYQRSGDMFLGVPFNVASYSALTYIIAYLTGLKPGKLIHIIGDAHIYLNHQKQVKEQLSRTPMPLPKLEIVKKDTIKTIDDFKLDNFMIEEYNSWPSIKAKMAI